MYTVLIADDDRDFVTALCNRLNEEPDFKVVSKVYNGKTAIEQIERIRPDIVVLDIIMPESDGVYAVDHIRNKMSGYDPLIYMLSGIGTSKIIKTLNALNIDFYSMKPVPLDIVIQNLRTILERQGIKQPHTVTNTTIETTIQKGSLTDTVKEVVFQLGLLPHRLSAKCTVDALVYYLEHPDCYHVLTKVLYPEIAKKYGLNNLSVERNIRSSIALMQQGNTALFQKIFAYAENKRITNSEFLAVVSEYISRQYDISRQMQTIEQS